MYFYTTKKQNEEQRNCEKGQKSDNSEILSRQIKGLDQANPIQTSKRDAMDAHKAISFQRQRNCRNTGRQGQEYLKYQKFKRKARHGPQQWPQ